ncbi:hypothetical protein ONZ51_g6441 [Trametes cubensis]|uniref:Uncharacterized protein n=1 Tax=Trametes cubensis TaxID=1111947 RepID=A0AAD7TT67_9APHY|nr:hypothetical protein ONZ51_g6441 [Trametes cubensis]
MSTRRNQSALAVAPQLHTVECRDDAARGRYDDGTKVAYQSSDKILLLDQPTFTNLRCLILENAHPSLSPKGLSPQDILDCLFQLRCVQNVTIRNMLPIVNTVAPPERPLHELPYIYKFVMEEHPLSMRYVLAHLKITPLVSLVSLTVGRLFPAEGDHPCSGLFPVLPQNTECLPMLQRLTRAELRCRPNDQFGEVVAEILDEDGKRARGRLSLRMRTQGVFPDTPVYHLDHPCELLFALYAALAFGPLTAASASLNTLVFEVDPITLTSERWGILFASYPALQHLVVRAIESRPRHFSTAWRFLDALVYRRQGRYVNCPGLQTIVLDQWANTDTLVAELEATLRNRFEGGAARLTELVVEQKPLPPGVVRRQTLGNEFLGGIDQEKYVRLLAQYVDKLSVTIDGRRYA